MDEIVVLDFETTGLSPAYARIIEVGAAIVRDTKIVATLSQLMDPGCYIPHFITEITGITNKMVKEQPKPEKIMPILKKFIGNRPIVAHNASFDQKFLEAELENANLKLDNEFLCTLKLSRRLIPEAKNYQLTTLVSHLKLNISKEHKAHRALDDVMATVQLWLYLKKHIGNHINRHLDLALLLKIMRQPKSATNKLLLAH